VWAVIFLLLGGLVAEGQTTTLKLGSLMPSGSPWDLTLRKMAAEWSEISGGRVEMIVYPGGVAGDEAALIRKMRIGQIQCAGITIRGVNKIAPGSIAVAAPMLYRDDEELDYVFARLRDTLEDRVEAQGYVVLMWNQAGWVQFLAQQPVITPDDLRGLRMWIWEGETEEEQVWRAQGFQPVTRPATEIMVGLQTGAIQAMAANPVAAAGYQWFTAIPHLSDLLWAPFLGAVVVRQDVWNRIPSDMRERMRASARRYETELTQKVREANKRAIQVMEEYGLTLHMVPPEARRQWEELAKVGFGSLLGKTLDPDLYALAERLVAEYRNGKRPS
jgi:TRAP-type C4-dicarboxylate transport system substrate-binding protein